MKGAKVSRSFPRPGDGIVVILEEVINRRESKIDLFCSGTAGRQTGVEEGGLYIGR